jgi:hypothetical protein
LVAPLLQSRYAGLADFVWQLDLSQLDQQGLAAASAAAAATADAAALRGGSSSPTGSTGAAPGDALLLPFALPAASSEPASPDAAAPARPGGDGAGSPGQLLSAAQLQAALAATQLQASALLTQLERSLHERDAALYRLDQLEQHLHAQQHQGQLTEQWPEQQTGDGATPGAIEPAAAAAQPASPPASISGSTASSSPAAPSPPPATVRWALRAVLAEQPLHQPRPGLPAGDRVQQLLQELSGLVVDIAAGDPHAPGSKAAAVQLQQYCAELQARVDILRDRAAASTAAADQLQQLLCEERGERRQQEQRAAAAARQQRAARQEQLLLQQHVSELEVGVIGIGMQHHLLACCGIVGRIAIQHASLVVAQPPVRFWSVCCFLS